MELFAYSWAIANGLAAWSGTWKEYWKLVRKTSGERYVGKSFQMGRDDLKGNKDDVRDWV